MLSPWKAENVHQCTCVIPAKIDIDHRLIVVMPETQQARSSPRHSGKAKREPESSRLWNPGSHTGVLSAEVTFLHRNDGYPS